MLHFNRLAVLLGALVAAVVAVPVDTARDPTEADIADRYIITLKSGVTARDIASHIDWVGEVHKRSLSRRDDLAGVEGTVDIEDFHAYYGKFDEATVDEIMKSPEVAIVEPEQIFTVSASVSQNGSTWGLATISHSGPGFNSYVYDDAASGAGSWAYVLDSGINVAHVDFGGRAVRGYNAAGGSIFDDRDGHGTHVAGIIGGATYGVLKGVNLVDVRVFNTGGATTSTILDAFQWTVNHIVSNGRAARSVINMSLSSRGSDTYNAAIKAAYDAGILCVVAAGNSAIPADSRSPASAPEAITVGALMSTWLEPGYSNYGPAVDVLAPGSDVLSAYIGSTTETESMTGTSMASPHVAGLALYLAELENLNTPAEVTARIKELAWKGAATLSWPDTPNLVAFNGNPNPAV